MNLKTIMLKKEASQRRMNNSKTNSTNLSTIEEYNFIFKNEIESKETINTKFRVLAVSEGRQGNAVWEGIQGGVNSVGKFC